jgi:type I restriction enzyme S subunit
MKLKKYDSYASSSLGWVNEIPSSWQVKRNKEIFTEICDCRSSGEETLLTVSHITGITPRSEKNVNMFFAETMEGYKKCRKGDLIINTMWAWMGALGTSKYNGICSPAYNIYRKNKGIDYNPVYFDLLFRTPNFIKEMTRFSKGIVDSRLRLYPKDFYRIETFLPSFSEQTQIANYLDRKIKAIDKKIKLLEQKIAYYIEFRRSLINESVSRGLNKDVELKDCGIDWIGMIPAHWHIMRLKSLGVIETSSVNKKIEEDEELVKLVNYTDIFNNVKGELWNREDYMYVSAKKHQIKTKKLKKGDVLFTPSSETIEDIGVSALVMENLINTLYSYHVLRFRFCQKIFLNFKKYLLNNDFVQFYFSKSATGTTRKILGLNTFYNLPIFLPPTNEQEKIAKFLDDRTSKIDQIVSNIKKQIEFLKELHKTLINDVVTGKIKVLEPVENKVTE